MKIIKNCGLFGDYIAYYPKDLSINIKFDEINYDDKAIIVLNRVYHDSDLANLDAFLKSLKDKEFFGIIFSDLAVYELSIKYNLTNKLIYDPNTLITNYEDFNFWNEFNILGVFVSPFVLKDDLIKIGKEKKLKLFFQGYGHLNMFYSRRPLITNFMEFNQIVPEKYLNRVLYLEEETRNERYPIMEINGETLIYSPYIFSCLDQLEELKDYIDYLYIDNSLDDLSPVSDGFFHKKTVYRR